MAGVRLLAQLEPPAGQPIPPAEQTGKEPGDSGSRKSVDGATRWRQLFQGETVKPETVRQLASELTAAKKYEDVISLLEQALIHGKAQPWMYEVLALNMEIAGRPRAQIERVLLSSQDLTPPDAESLMFLAAYLARFERFEQAIKCCRQAAELEPNRPEPYVSALRYARRAREIDTQAWAAIGILTTSWGPEQAAMRDEAAAAADDVRKSWKAAGRWVDLAAFEQAVVSANRVDLRFRLEWSGAGDMDLQVLEPKGSLCSRERVYSTGGGIFLHDGSGPNPRNCYDEYACPIAWNGEYRVRILHSWGNIVGKRATLTIIRATGDTTVDREVVGVDVSPEGTELRVLLKTGRRQEAAAARAISRQRRLRPKTASSTILAQLQPGLGNVGPGVGGGGIGFQPVIQNIAEGVSLAAMATVSADRRYVRLSLAPVFSNITDVFTFSFQR